MLLDANHQTSSTNNAYILYRQFFLKTEYNMKEKQTGNKNVLQFIQNFLNETTHTKAEQQILKDLFTKKYCYYFAKILQDAFSRGSLYWITEKDHIVWKDTSGILYDINGIFELQDKTKPVIPIFCLGEGILDFKHVPGNKYNATDQEIADWIITYQNMQQ